MTSASAPTTPLPPPLSVVSRYHPGTLSWHADGEPILCPPDKRNDGWDDFNHPRNRRAMILWELAGRYLYDEEQHLPCLTNNNIYDEKQEPPYVTNNIRIAFFTPPSPKSTTQNLKDTAYSKVHSEDLLEFLSTGWGRWDALGEAGQDPMSTLKHNLVEDADDGEGAGSSQTTPPLIPGNVPLPRDPHQRPSRNVMGQMGYYCTDTCTPVFAELLEELLWDLEDVQMAVNMALENVETNTEDVPSPSSSSRVIYALCTHPGHHAARDSFGGYCYVNHAALAARLLQDGLMKSCQNVNPTEDNNQVNKPKVAILDVDYHCGNGSASIFYEDPTVLVVSIHCHPDHEYPFHSGFDGAGDGEGATLHLPLMPGTSYSEYETALQRAMDEIQRFGAQALVVSLGLDTHSGDPCAIRRAGFLLEGDDYVKMGTLIGSKMFVGSDDDNQTRIPVVVIQEGGYKMDKVPSAAADFLLGMAEATTVE